MPIDFSLPIDELISIAVSLFCGAVIGLEREYRNKSTGLRTIILICLGSTVFTIVSHHGSGSDDRIGANIITGIGFIGAGVIFKDKMGVLGLTTAAVIWVAAAIGMTAGFGAHSTALTVTGVTMLILLFFGKLEGWVNSLPQNLGLTITFHDASPQRLEQLQDTIRSCRLRGKQIGLSKSDNCVAVSVQIRGRAEDISRLQTSLLQMEDVKGFY
jgi:putative Mg2+ transporter-C (MgtC) family protein